MKEYVGIYIKTEKAQEQDGFGNKMKYHFHVTTCFVAKDPFSKYFPIIFFSYIVITWNRFDQS